MKQFEKWWKNHSFDRVDKHGVPLNESDYKYYYYDGWKAALKCVRDGMLSSCGEDFMEIYSFINKELEC